jgi:uncharacterized protein
MSKFSFIFFLSILLGVSISIAQVSTPKDKVIGSWTGSLTLSGMDLPIVFHIDADPSGELRASMDSPKQGAKGIPVQSVKLTGDSLFLNIRAIGGSFEGKIESAKKINGIFRQGGQALSLELIRGSVEESRRPQEPNPPFPYLENEVLVENAAARIKLAGTLTMPSEKGTFPAVVLITGSGPQNRNHEILGHKPFLVISDYLTRRGFAVLRLDDRGFGKSEGDFATATTNDFASDINAAFEFLRKQPGVESKKVGLVGHSEGALIASKVAAQNKNVAFAVLLAGSGVRGVDLLVMQNEAILKIQDLPQNLLDQYLNLRRKQFEAAASDLPTPELQQKVRQLEQEAKDQMSSEEISKLGLSPQAEQSVVIQLSSPWMRFFLNYDPAVDLRRIKVPVLALIGSKDVQVPSQPNLAAIEKALKSGGNKRFVVKEMPGLNHLFQHANTGLPNEYGQIEETFAPVAMSTFEDWMKRVVK